MRKQRCAECSERSDALSGTSFPIYYAKTKSHETTGYLTVNYTDIGKEIVFFCQNCNERSKKKAQRIGIYISVFGAFLFFLGCLLTLVVPFAMPAGWSPADWVEILALAICMIGPVGVLLGALLVALGKTSLNEAHARDIVKSNLSDEGYNCFMTEKEFEQMKRSSRLKIN